MTDDVITVGWPLGPDYADWVSADTGTATAWSLYKLRAATWYIDLLSQIGRSHGFARLAGVEMALDGAVTSLSSAFDAAVAGIIVASEERLRVQAEANGSTAPQPVPKHLYSWRIARGYLEDADVLGTNPETPAKAASVLREIDAALVDPPQGWLTILRRLRNRAAHQDTLARHIDLHVGGPHEGTTWQITVEGAGVDPVSYLREAHGRVHDLVTDHLLPFGEYLAPHGMATTPGNTSQAVTIHAAAAVAKAAIPPPELTAEAADASSSCAMTSLEPNEAKVDAAWRVVFQVLGGTEVLPGVRIELLELPAPEQRVDVVLWTRHEARGLAAPLPMETFLEIELRAPDHETALLRAGEVSVGLAAMISLCVNAHVPPPEPWLAYEIDPDLQRRRLWQRYLPRVDTSLRPRRMLDPTLLTPLMGALLANSASEISRAVGQYQVALMYWTTRSRPLALPHLYIALEALALAIEPRRRAIHGVTTAKEHARQLGIDVGQSDWKNVLLGALRRDVLCQGDRLTYQAARKARNGLQHGSLDLPAYRTTADEITAALIGYVRAGILNAIDLDEQLRSTLLSKTPIDTSPLWHEVTTELSGEVANAALLTDPGSDIPHPHLEWDLSVAQAERTSDGRLNIGSNLTVTLRAKEGVQFDEFQHRAGVGLNELDSVLPTEPDRRTPA